MSELIAVLIFPIPLFHLWLHGLLPFWRRHPVWFYIIGALMFAGSVWFVPKMALISISIIAPSTWLVGVGYFLLFAGGLLVLSSFLTLGPRRFFVWAVLRPDSAKDKRIVSGPFAFVPHPAYFGYLLAALGNFLTVGDFYLAVLFIFLLAVTPVVIWLEEHELGERVGQV